MRTKNSVCCVSFFFEILLSNYSLLYLLHIIFLAFILPIVLSDEHSNKKLTDLPLKVAAILVNDEESNVSFIGSFEMTNDTKINNTELIKEIKFYYYSRWFI